MREQWNRALEWLKPKYNELTTYLTALTCVILFFTHPEFRRLYFEILSGAGADRASLAFFALGLLATLGFFLSIMHVFTKRTKTDFEKTCMTAFVMGANGFAGIAAGVEMLPARWSLLALFPIWNICMGVLLLYQIGVAKDPITDENASPWEVFTGSIILVFVFVLTNSQFHLTWAMIFSICMFYSTTLIFLITWTLNYFNLRSFTKKSPHEYKTTARRFRARR